MAVLQDILTVDLMPNRFDFLAIYGRVFYQLLNLYSIAFALNEFFLNR